MNNLKYPDVKVFNNDGLSNVVNGKGDIGSDQELYISPKAPVRRTDKFFGNLYRGTGIAGAIIDRPVDRSVRVGWQIKSSAEKLIIEELKRLKFVKHLKKALKYERTYGGALIVFGLNDSSDLTEPVSPGYSKGIDFIRVYRREQVIKDNLLDNPENARHGKPEVFTISATGYNPYSIHWTRCIELEGIPVDEDVEAENDGWGDSVLINTWDCISRYDDTLDTMKRIANNFVNLSIEIDGLFQAIRAGQENDIRKRLALFNSTMHSMNFAIHDKDEKIDKIASNVSGLKDIFQAMVDDCSTSSGMPTRVLFGKQIGGLNNSGEGETNDWVEYIEDFLNEKVLYIIEETIPFLTNAPFEIKWNPVKTPTAKEQAEIYKLVSEADKINIVDSQVLQAEECRQSHYGGDEFSINVQTKDSNNDEAFSPEDVEASEKDTLMQRNSG